MNMQMLLLLLLLLGYGVYGQQVYDEKDQFGYLCSDSKTLARCSTFVIYRPRDKDTLQSISDRFKVSSNEIARASNISNAQQPLLTNQSLFIPVPACSCVAGRSQYNVTYVTQKGDTMSLVSISTFEGLTTYQAVERANPSAVPTALLPGDELIFPLRCACPSSNQNSKGVQLLATYPITGTDTVQSISKAWSVSVNDIFSANELTPNSKIAENTTILLPFGRASYLSRLPPSLQPSPPLSSLPPSLQPLPRPPAASAPLPSPATVTGDSSNTGLIVRITCGAAALIAVML
ncbi:hypothetical protein O6H91_03G043900 [Diphasiastrum complanatum]|uniref:Uncharacterized protein n=1 Tax=Diphasiastrum complanatum TaxID=34168 RepID=A0ACC2E5W2_DIPCM|nr:hypothetical protein O6H91_03G043900 [Diphasiastrum complanatum]